MSFIKDIVKKVINSYAHDCPLQLYIKDILYTQAQKGRAHTLNILNGSQTYNQNVGRYAVKSKFKKSKYLQTLVHNIPTNDSSLYVSREENRIGRASDSPPGSHNK